MSNIRDVKTIMHNLMAYSQTAVVLGGFAHVPIAIGVFYLAKAFMYRGDDGKIAPFSFGYRLDALRRRESRLAGDSVVNSEAKSEAMAEVKVLPAEVKSSPVTAAKPTSEPEVTLEGKLETNSEGTIEAKSVDP